MEEREGRQTRKEREKQLKRDVAERETRVRERDRGPIPNGPLRPTKCWREDLTGVCNMLIAPPC